MTINIIRFQLYYPKLISRLFLNDIDHQNSIFQFKMSIKLYFLLFCKGKINCLFDMFKDIILSWYNLNNDFDIKMISIFKANPFDIKCS